MVTLAQSVARDSRCRGSSLLVCRTCGHRRSASLSLTRPWRALVGIDMSIGQRRLSRGSRGCHSRCSMHGNWSWSGLQWNGSARRRGIDSSGTTGCQPDRENVFWDVNPRYSWWRNWERRGRKLSSRSKPYDEGDGACDIADWNGNPGVCWYDPIEPT
jgi:hypothetical protein